MKSNIFYFLFFFLIGLPGGFSQTTNIPAPAQNGAILLLGGTAHLGNGQTIANSAIGFDQGKLTLVADASTARIDRSAYKQVIDIQGKHVYPGFFLPSTDLGLNEVSSIPDMRDASEQGDYNPSVRAIMAYNTDSEVIPALRFNGILMAQTTPTGGLVSGNSSIVQLDAWNWEDAAYQTDDAIHFNWPQRQLNPRFFLGETTPRRNEDYDKNIQEVRQLLTEAKAYGQQTGNRTVNLSLDALQGLFNGSKAFFLHTDDAKAMVEGITMARQSGISRIVVVGAGEAMLIKDFLKEHQVPVVITDIHSLPRRDHEDVVFPYKLPKMLFDAGIDFCFGSDQGNSRARNLPFLAGTTVAYGLPYEEAIKALTGNTARILGVASRVGTLETGKDATLFVSSGDALDMRTNNVELAFIQGRSIQMEGRQQFLYKKYSQKYGHK